MLLKRWYKKKFNRYNPLTVHPYLSYGTAERFYIRGRIIEEEGITLARENDSLVTNLFNMYRRIQSSEISGVTIEASFNEDKLLINNNKEGYFAGRINITSPPQGKLWHRVDLKVLESPNPFNSGQESHTEVLTPHPGSDFGIISDIDDTILETQATSLLRMTKNTFFYNHKTRSPIQGAADWYSQLAGKRAQNPFFYVSSSPWNLYDFLIRFIEINEFPRGPLLLKDYGFQINHFIGKGHLDHKTREITRILKTYPGLKFILIGDSGQKDPAVYSNILRSFPDRILAIYIHDVKVPAKTKIVEEISRGFNKDVPMILLKDAGFAIKDSRDRGFIS